MRLCLRRPHPRVRSGLRMAARAGDTSGHVTPPGGRGRGQGEAAAQAWALATHAAAATRSMSIRKDWSALSSLSRQRTLEDEEEQERERRRRNRTQSSTTEEGTPRSHPYSDQKTSDRLLSVEESQATRLPATEPRPPPSSPTVEDEPEDVQAILRSRKERRQRRQAVEGTQTQASLPERPQLEEERGDLGPNQAKAEPLEPLKSKEEAEESHRPEQRGPWAKEGVRSVTRQSGAEQGVSQKTPSAGKTPSSEKTPIPEKSVPIKRLVSEKTFTSKKAPERTSISETIVVSEKQSTSEKFVSENTGGSEKPPIPGKMGGSERHLVSEKAQLFEKSLVSEKTPIRETKPLLEKKPSSSAKQPVSRFPPITLQVKIPSNEENSDVSSPTYSSSLKRSSPRTISFRMSPKKETAEVALSRSASMRLPANASKLGEKLEKYQAALQRTNSLKSTRTEFFVTPSSVATRRHIFETEQLGKEQAGQASSLKENLKLSGVVTSKLNLWISRTQESGERPPGGAGRASRHQEGPVGSKEAGSTLDAEV